MRIISFCLANLLLLFVSSALHAQHKNKSNNPVYVDKQGVLRFTKNNAEASFFGVNYTAPFAYSYRAHKALNADPEKAIQQDVYHFARLGLDAFRVHVWDTEISDSLGNLLSNDHLRLFDFLVAELKKRNIKTIITPIAFWGNGYPERDERTPGFSRVYGKGRATGNDSAIKAQENYLKQFFKHVNPYTNLTYTDDPDVIAVELNNEPSHSGPRSGVTDYINRLVTAMKSIGWTKPLFYNVSQSTYYADAMVKANIEGLSFQWYPSGLVGGHAIEDNFLPNVDKYTIPYDTIPGYSTKAKMVYEFDAADILQSCMYPAMARSFREAGFQWATQFAYDPMALAYANTEYQTHYLSLPFTPSKAISLLIASEVFHKMPRLKNYGVYPADSVFDVFRVSYKEDLSEMNTDQKFYYSNNTQTKPVNSTKLTNIAGVGSSPVVHYEGSGAYFLDKIEDGVWRLEVMPDAIHTRDPFERASPKKEVTRIQWDNNPMQIMLPDLGEGFSIKGLNEGNNYTAVADADNFKVQPGTYLLVKSGKILSATKTNRTNIGLHEFVAPKPFSNDLFLKHIPFNEVSAGHAFTVAAEIVGLDTGRVSLQVSRLGGGGRGDQYRNIPMTRQTAVHYSAEIPAEMVTPGVLNYRIIIQQGNEFTVFPGNIRGNPFAWDNYYTETWKTFVAGEHTRLELFNPSTETDIRTFSSSRRGFQTNYITGERPGELILRLAVNELSGDHIFGFQYAFAKKGKGRLAELASPGKLMIRARSAGGEPVKAKITLTNEDAASFSTYIMLANEFQDIEIPLNDLFQDAALLLPGPYPGFLPSAFKGAASAVFKLEEMQKIQVMIGEDIPAAAFNKPYSVEVQSVWFQKNK